MLKSRAQPHARQDGNVASIAPNSACIQSQGIRKLQAHSVIALLGMAGSCLSPSDAGIGSCAGS